MARVTVRSSAGAYDVTVARGWDDLAEALPGAVVLVTDENVAPLWADAAVRALGREVPRVVLPAGEAHKDLDGWRRCVDALLAAGVDRATTVLALGGGVVGDLAGFAAATTLRGLPLAMLPTTLLAMVDSSVGGKVGVDHPRGKNLVGAFHPPVRVHAALETLATLPREELRSGLGEVAKTALVLDLVLFGLLEDHAEALSAGDPDALEEVIVRSVEAKARVVEADEREQGLRIVLNAGHTVGHALETAAGHGVLRHGEAVAIGLLAEARFAVAEGTCDPGLPERLERLLVRLGLPVRAPAVDREVFLGALGLDKKGRGDRIRIAFPRCAGSWVLAELDRARLQELLPR